MILSFGKDPGTSMRNPYIAILFISILLMLKSLYKSQNKNVCFQSEDRPPVLHLV